MTGAGLGGAVGADAKVLMKTVLGADESVRGRQREREKRGGK